MDEMRKEHEAECNAEKHINYSTLGNPELPF